MALESMNRSVVVCSNVVHKINTNIVILFVDDVTRPAVQNIPDSGPSNQGK